MTPLLSETPDTRVAEPVENNGRMVPPVAPPEIKEPLNAAGSKVSEKGQEKKKRKKKKKSAPEGGHIQMELF